MQETLSEISIADDLIAMTLLAEALSAGNNEKLIADGWQLITSFRQYFFIHQQKSMFDYFPQAYGDFLKKVCGESAPKSIDYIEDRIIHIYKTLCGKHLYIQSYSKGSVFNEKMQRVKKCDTNNCIRIYGKDINNYVDCDDSVNIINVNKNRSKRTIRNTSYGILNSYGKLLKLEDTEYETYKMIKIIKNVPYYIMK